MSRKSSQKRIEANRANAQKSTGPRTEEGKAKSSANATTHGLSRVKMNPLAPGCFLSMEDESRFQGVLDEYVATYNPQHRDELDLLTEAVFAKWRQQRLWLAETAQIELAIAQNESDLQKLPHTDAPAHLALGIAKSEQTLKLYLRYDAQLHHHYRQCLKDLRDLQDDRQANPLPSTFPPAASPNEANAPSEAKTPSETATPNEPQPPASQPHVTTEEALLLAHKAELRRLIDINLGRITP